MLARTGPGLIVGQGMRSDRALGREISGLGRGAWTGNVLGQGNIWAGTRLGQGICLEHARTRKAGQGHLWAGTGRSDRECARKTLGQGGCARNASFPIRNCLF